MIECGCGRPLEWERVEEIDERTCLARLGCSYCQSVFGVEGEGKELSPFLEGPVWTDAAQHTLDRMPPYVAPLVQQEVESYAAERRLSLISWATLQEAKNRGTLLWSPEAEQRLEKVPGPVRAMARVELERTALDRGMSEVTVSLMEEIKARYFGMGKG